jgi:hypothetical protein
VTVFISDSICLVHHKINKSNKSKALHPYNVTFSFFVISSFFLSITGEVGGDSGGDSVCDLYSGIILSSADLSMLRFDSSEETGKKLAGVGKLDITWLPSNFFSC